MTAIISKIVFSFGLLCFKLRLSGADLRAASLSMMAVTTRRPLDCQYGTAAAASEASAIITNGSECDKLLVDDHQCHHIVISDINITFTQTKCHHSEYLRLL